MPQIITVDKEIPFEVPVEVIQYVDRVVEVPVEVEKVVEIEKLVTELSPDDQDREKLLISPS